MVPLTQAWQQCEQPFLQARRTPAPDCSVASTFPCRKRTAASMFLSRLAVSKSACMWRAMAATGSGSLDSGSIPDLSRRSSSLLWRRRSARFIRSSSVAAHRRRLDLKDDTLLAGLGERVFVLAQIFLGERIDVAICILL